jgi:subtilisin family serine protease
MKKAFLIAVLIAVVSVHTAWSQIQADDAIAPEKWVIVLEDPRPERLQGWQRTGYRGGGNYRSALELKRFGKRLAKDHNLALQDQWLIESLGVYCLIVTFNDDKLKTIEALKKVKRVKWLQTSNDFELLSASLSTVSKLEDTIPKADRATLFPASLTGEGVTIAMVDSRVDITHPDLTDAITATSDFVILSDELLSATQAQLGEAHGTAIAGVIVARTNSKLGISGVAPKARLLAYRGCWEKGDGKTYCNTLSLARSLDAVARSKADILNLSLSGPKDILLDELINRIIANGTVVVAAFDPERVKKSRFPSERNGVLIVRAEMMDSQFSDVFTAPGARVVASPGSGYDFKKGHSIATAFTSGVLALRKQAEDAAVGGKVNWREFSEISNAVDLVGRQSSSNGRALLTNQYVVLPDRS